MNYIYHRVPLNMTGTTLFPLNVLKSKYPLVYQKHSSKYQERENIMADRLPVLNCLWNDVLHLSAVHPAHIKEALIEAGDTGIINLECFEIDPHVLDPEKTLVYLYKHTTEAERLKEENFLKYDPNTVALYSIIPKETKAYYNETYAQGKNPFLFHKIPHILFRGELNITSFKKVSV